MRCVGVCAFREKNPVAVLRRFSLFPFASNDLSIFPEVLFGALRVVGQVPLGQLRLPSCRSWSASAVDSFRFCADRAHDRVRECAA